MAANLAALLTYSWLASAAARVLRIGTALMSAQVGVPKVIGRSARSAV